VIAAGGADSLCAGAYFAKETAGGCGYINHVTPAHIRGIFAILYDFGDGLALVSPLSGGKGSWAYAYTCCNRHLEARFGAYGGWRRLAPVLLRQ
jgi:hypothetical protein